MSLWLVSELGYDKENVYKNVGEVVLITEFDLKLANYIQDKEAIDFESCVTLFEKSASTIKRSVYRLNAYLPEELHFRVQNHTIETEMTYSDYVRLCQELELKNYSPSVEERLDLAICYGFLQEIVNMTELYQSLYLSLSTKKKDRKKLGFLLEENEVEIVNRHSLGTSFHGNERFLRMFVAKELMAVIELDKSDNFVERLANTPIQRLLYEQFKRYLGPYHYEVIGRLDQFLGSERSAIDYASKKFIYIHAAISLMRIEKGYEIPDKLTDIPKVPQHHILPSEKDSAYFDYLIASLNYKEPFSFPVREELKGYVSEFIERLEVELEVYFHTYRKMHDELYAYLYKAQIKNRLAYYFDDDKLDDTKHIHSELYDVIEDNIKGIFPFEFTEAQVSMICLIVKRFIIKNRLNKQERKKIVVITNSSVEKVSYFLEELAQHVNFEMVSYLTINELYALEELDFNTIITFSNRIAMLLADMGRDSIKLNFYLTPEDLDKLYACGFVKAQTVRVLAAEIVDDLEEKKTKQEKTTYLKTTFPQYTI